MLNIFLRYLITSTICSIIFLLFSKVKFIKNNIINKYIFYLLIVFMLITPSMPKIYNIYNNIYNNSYNNAAYNMNTVKSENSAKINSENTSINSGALKQDNPVSVRHIHKTKLNIDTVTKSRLEKSLNILSIVWIAGVLISIMTFLYSLYAFMKKVEMSSQINDSDMINILNHTKSNLNIKRKINLLLCNNIKSPCIFGIFKYNIYIPKYVYNKCSNEEMNHIILHELLHYKRKDSIYNFLMMMALSIHWFNPFIWNFIKSFKECSECAVDMSVLKYLGENNSVNYGTTLLNLSKNLLYKNSYYEWALCFENKNQLKGRIKMITNFKNGCCKKSAVAVAVCCLINFAGFTCNAYAGNLVENSSIDSLNTSSKNHNFIIDEDIKEYNSLERLMQVMDYSFKVPEYILNSAKISTFQMDKINHNEYAAEIFYDYKDLWYRVTVSKSKPFNVLIKIDALHNGEIDPAGCSKENKNINGINGQVITLKGTSSDSEDYSSIEKYFSWQNDGLYYSINYYNYEEQNNEKYTLLNLSDKDIYNIASSLTAPDNNLKAKYKIEENTEYNTETPLMGIYDKDDIKNAEDYLKFSPKLPLNIGNYKIKSSSISYLKKENKKPLFELLSFYEFNDISMTISESKCSDNFDKVSKNDYYTITDDNNNVIDKFKVNRLKVNDIDVYEYNEAYADDTDNDESLVFNWKENDKYYSMSFFKDKSINVNYKEIIKEFMED